MERMHTKRKVCIVVSSPMTIVAFLRDQLRELSSAYDLHVFANSPDAAFLDEIGVRASFSSIPLKRNISPWHDLLALLVLWRHFRRIKPDAVHSVTPKAGLLGMAAAFLAGVRCRIHTFTGQVWATKRGASRWILWSMDCLIAFFASRILVDSFSQREFLLANRVVSPHKATVLGQGSISGVDLLRFKPDPASRVAVRMELAVAQDALVFLYVGRLKRDKGIPELVEAFAMNLSMHPAARLLLVGPDEDDLEFLFSKQNNILRVGYTNEPERYMAAADVFVLPSHREGFGSTVIEAAACGLPTVASRIYGLTDAVVDGETGLLHECGDVQGLAAALAILSADSDKRSRMGICARERAARDFAMEAVTRNTMDFYREALDACKTMQ